MMNYSNMDLNVKEGVSDKIDGVTVSELVYDGVVLQPSLSHQDTAFEFAKESEFLIVPRLMSLIKYVLEKNNGVSKALRNFLFGSIPI